VLGLTRIGTTGGLVQELDTFDAAAYAAIEIAIIDPAAPASNAARIHGGNVSALPRISVGSRLASAGAGPGGGRRTTRERATGLVQIKSNRLRISRSQLVRSARPPMPTAMTASRGGWRDSVLTGGRHRRSPIYDLATRAPRALV
jgi:hypothetical protein